SIGPHSLLALDLFHGHLTDSLKNRFDEKNANLAVIPGGLTKIKKLTPTGCIQCPAYNLVAQWVEISWDKIDPILKQDSLKCCGISNSQDGSEDKYIFDEWKK
ncbi:1709_t:CDS:2, partial [Diversispora eburnea]